MEKIIKIPSSYRYYKLADLKNICGITYADASIFYGGLYTMLITTDALKAILARKIQKRITPELLAKVRIGLGVVLIIFGIVLIVRSLWTS